MMKFIYLVVFLLSFSFVAAAVGYDNPNLYGIRPVTPTNITFINQSVNVTEVNSTDFWDTDQGSLKNINSTQFEEIGQLLTAKNSYWDAFYCLLTGCIMTDDINMSSNSIENVGNITVEDKIFVGNKSQWIESGSDFFNAIASNAFHFRNNFNETSGTVLMLLSHQNNSNFWVIERLNNSASGLANSFIAFPNNDLNETDKTNMNLTSNARQRWINYGFDPLLDYDSSLNETGIAALFGFESQKLILHNDLGNGQLLGQGDFRWVSGGGDIDLYEGAVHIKDEKVKLFGLPTGFNFSVFSENFEGLSLGDFTLITMGKGSDEWSPEIDTGDCPAIDGGLICARAGPLGGSGDTIMQANYSTINIKNQTLNFSLNTIDMSSGGDFEVMFNNNIGSGDVSIYSLVGADVFDTIIETPLPVTMDNQTTITINFIFSSSHPIRGQSFVDNIEINGTTIISTEQNVTVEDGKIEFGNGACIIEMSAEENFNELNLTCDNINLFGNTTFINVVEVELNVTDNATIQNTLFVDFIDSFSGNGITLLDNVTITGFDTGDVTSNEIDLRIGTTHGALQIGMIQQFQGTMSVGGLDLNGTFVTRFGNGDSTIRYIWTGNDNKVLYAIPKEGADYARYGPRSEMTGGDLGQQFDDGIINCTAQGYNNASRGVFVIDCDTSTVPADGMINSGADHGIADTLLIGNKLLVWKDMHIGGTSFLNELNVTGTSNFTGEVVGDGNATFDNFFGNINASFVQNAPWLTSESDPLAYNGTLRFTDNHSFEGDVNVTGNLNGSGNINFSNFFGSTFFGSIFLGGDSTGNAQVNAFLSGDLKNGSGNVTYSWVGNLGTGMRRAASNELAFDTSAMERVRISSGGNIGIGTSSPNVDLEVVGDGNFSNNLTALNINATSRLDVSRDWYFRGAKVKMAGASFGHILYFDENGSWNKLGVGQQNTQLTACPSSAVQELKWTDVAGAELCPL